MKKHEIVWVTPNFWTVVYIIRESITMMAAVLLSAPASRSWRTTWSPSPGCCWAWTPRPAPGTCVPWVRETSLLLFELNEFWCWNLNLFFFSYFLRWRSRRRICGSGLTAGCSRSSAPPVPRSPSASTAPSRTCSPPPRRVQCERRLRVWAPGVQLSSIIQSHIMCGWFLKIFSVIYFRNCSPFFFTPPRLSLKLTFYYFLLSYTFLSILPRSFKKKRSFFMTGEGNKKCEMMHLSHCQPKVTQHLSPFYNQCD